MVYIMSSSKQQAPLLDKFANVRDINVRLLVIELFKASSHHNHISKSATHDHEQVQNYVVSLENNCSNDNSHIVRRLQRRLYDNCHYHGEVY